MVLIMSVNPGFGGQKYISYASKKVKEVRDLSEKYNKNLLIEVDGGVTKENIKELHQCGADIIVAGSAVFKNGEIAKNIKLLKEALV